MCGEAYVVFEKGKSHWWTRFLNKEISHCYIIIIDKGRYIIYSKSYIKTDIYTIDELDDILSSSYTVKVKIKTNSNGQRRIVSKEIMRNKGFDSPDDADALMMALFASKFIGKKIEQNEDFKTPGIPQGLEKQGNLFKMAGFR